VFQVWEGTLRDTFTAHGFWSDTADPRTGAALHGTATARYSEAVGAQIFRGYPVATHRLVSAVQHPRHGVHTYPVTLFTTAPPVTVHAALVGACTIDASELHAHMPAAPGTEVPLLAVRDATVAARQRGARGSELHGAMLCVAESVSFEVAKGQRVVIRGPPGAGKSTFVSALHGLLPLSTGSVAWAPRVCALHVPQEPVMSPSASLCEQLMYPERGACDAQTAVALLDAVGVGYLWERCNADVAFGGHDAGWRDQQRLPLSHGEMQCLAIARVLRAQPDIALLDEAFSAVPEDTEVALLDALASAGVTCVMVNHRADSVRGADLVITMSADLPGGWCID
jgi:energy-coupling factor transporter ATP-binding protein EcfA2